MAIEYRADNAADVLNRLYLRISAKKFNEATADIQALKKKIKGSPLVDYADGLLAFQQGKYAEAATAFDKVISADNTYLPALFYGGAAHFMQNNAGQAEEYLSRFNLNRPNYPPVLFLLVFLCLLFFVFFGAVRLF